MSLAVGKKRLFLLKSIEHDTSRFWLYTEKGGSKKCKLVAMPVFAWTCFCLMFAVRFGSGCFLAGSWVSCHTTATSLYSQKGFYAVACWTWLISPYEQKGRKDSNFYVHSDLCNFWSPCNCWDDWPCPNRNVSGHIFCFKVQVSLCWLCPSLTWPDFLTVGTYLGLNGWF